ncbi:type VI secretion system TssO [Taibaiella koreensis]|uniref:type VI secretion system TssO n=1 Tax=Taibaiella koreensis TaxID=1268548 RepID=UPI000E59F69F|nr:type VI secretion system TssO [Taibaiella koreensis]
MEETIKMSRKEKRHYLWYLIALYIGSAAIFSWIIFLGVPNPFSSISNQEREQLNQAKIFEARQIEALQIYDTVMQKVTALKSNPGNQIVEADIEQRINYLNSLNDGLPNRDMRTYGFYQMAKYLNNHFQNAKILRKKSENIQLFEKQLSDCRIGYQQNEQYMNQIRAAQSGR